VFGGHTRIQDKSYLHNDLFHFDTKTVTWRKVETSGDIPCERYSHTATFVPPSHLIFIGGGMKTGGSDEVFILDTEKLVWKKAETTGVILSHVYHTTVPMLGKLWVFGGRSASGSTTYSDIWTLNLANLAWEKVEVFSSKPCSRYYHGATVVDSKMYVFGGRDNASRFNDLHIFDPKTLTWSQIQTQGETPGCHSGHTCCAVGKNIYVFGGYNGVATLNELHILNTETLTWHKPHVRGAPPPGRYLHTLTPVGSKLYLFGGCTEDGHIDDLYSLEVDYPPSLTDLCTDYICKYAHVLPEKYEHQLPQELRERIHYALKLTSPPTSPEVSFFNP
jgi:hypothetical protein